MCNTRDTLITSIEEKIFLYSRLSEKGIIKNQRFMFDIELIGFSFDVLGKLLIAYAALRVHHRVLHEHKVDVYVFKSMKREQFLGIVGAILIVIGFGLIIASKLA